MEKIRWANIRDLPLGEVGGKVDILVGSDYLHRLITQETRMGKEYEPIATRTRLGWIVRGVSNKKSAISAIRSFTISGRTLLDYLAAEMRNFCDTEDFRTELTKGCISHENQRVMVMVKKTRKLAVGYEVPFIWREGKPNISAPARAEMRLRSCHAENFGLELCLSSGG